MIKSILIPVNDSENNNKALRYGALMALRMEKPIHLLKVIDPRWIPVQEPVGPTGIASGIEPFGTTAIKIVNRKDLLAAAQKENDKITEELKAFTFNKVAIKSTISQGEPTKVIFQHTEQNPDDLLVIGQEDSPTGWESLIGNTTTQLLGTLNNPIMVVPEEIPFRSIHRILYLVEDFSFIEESVENLRLLDPTNNPHIHIILSYSGIQDQSAWDSAKLESSILEQIKYPKVGIEIRGEKDLYTIAQEKAAKQPVDLIVLHHRSRNFLLERFYMPNAAEKMAFTTDCPLLIFPDPR